MLGTVTTTQGTMNKTALSKPRSNALSGYNEYFYIGTMDNYLYIKGVAQDEHREFLPNYADHHSSTELFLTSFSSMFWFSDLQLFYFTLITH